MNRIASLSGGTGALKLGQVIAGIAVAVVLARWLGPEAFGLYAFGVSVATLLAIPIKNGLSELLVRELSRARETQDFSHSAGMTRWCLRISLGYFAVCGAVLIGLSVVWNDPLSASLVGAVGLIPGLALLGIGAAGLRSIDRPVAAMFPDTILRPMLFLLVFGLAVVLTTATSRQPTAILQMHATAALFCALALLAAYRRIRPAPLRDAVPARIVGSEWVWRAVTFSLVGGLMVANRQIDLIILGILQGEVAAGLYRVAVQGAMLLTFGSQAVNIVTAPIFARQNAAVSGMDKAALHSLVRTNVLVSASVAFAGLVFMVIFGRVLIYLLFGEAYLEAYGVLVILSLANALSMINAVAIPLLNMSGKEGATLRAFGFATATNAACAIALVPFFGLTGAAVAALMSSLVWSLVLRRDTIQNTGIDPIMTVFRRQPDA